jgi:hypothetical protein
LEFERGQNSTFNVQFAFIHPDHAAEGQSQQPLDLGFFVPHGVFQPYNTSEFHKANRAARHSFFTTFAERFFEFATGLSVYQPGRGIGPQIKVALHRLSIELERARHLHERST